MRDINQVMKLHEKINHGEQWRGTKEMQKQRSNQRSSWADQVYEPHSIYVPLQLVSLDHHILQVHAFSYLISLASSTQNTAKIPKFLIPQVIKYTFLWSYSMNANLKLHQ